MVQCHLGQCPLLACDSRKLVRDTSMSPNVGAWHYSEHHQIMPQFWQMDGQKRKRLWPKPTPRMDKLHNVLHRRSHQTVAKTRQRNTKCLDFGMFNHYSALLTHCSFRQLKTSQKVLGNWNLSVSGSHSSLWPFVWLFSLIFGNIS
jgi:hypothetical protein